MKKLLCSLLFLLGLSAPALADGTFTVTNTGQLCTAATCTLTGGYTRADATAQAITANLPAATGTYVPITVCKIDSSANAVTVTRAGSDTIDGGTTWPLASQYQCAKFTDSASGAWTADFSAYPVTQTAPANQFVTGITSKGVFTTAQPTDANLSLSDITTNNVSTSAHGFTPKLSNDVTTFLNGVGTFSVPPTGGGGVNTGLQGQIGYYKTTTTISGKPGVCLANAQAGNFGAQVSACMTQLPAGGIIDATGYGQVVVFWTSTITLGTASNSAPVSYTLLVDNHTTRYECRVNNAATDCIDLNPGSAIIDANAGSIQNSTSTGGGFATLATGADVRDILRTINQGNGASLGTGGSLRGLVMGCAGGTLEDGGAVVHLIGIQQSFVIESLEAGSCHGSVTDDYLVKVEDSASFGVTGVSMYGNGTLNCTGGPHCVPMRMQTTTNTINSFYIDGYQFQHEGSGNCEFEMSASSGHNITGVVIRNSVIESSHTNANGFCISATGSLSALIDGVGISAANSNPGIDIIHITDATNMDNFRVMNMFDTNAWTNWVTNSTSGYTQTAGGAAFREYAYYRSGLTQKDEVWDTVGGVILDLSTGNGLGYFKTGTAVAKLGGAPGTSIGAAKCQIFAVAGTNGGSCKLQSICGTSTTPVTILDNIGSGC